MKAYQKDTCLDFFYPARCPVCGRILRDVPGLRRRAHPPALCELICRPCFFRLPFVPEAHCMVCGRPLENPLAERCDDCRRYRHAFLEARAAFSYKADVQKALYQLKYGGRKEYARFFAAAMAQYLSPWIRSRGITMLVPVPLHPSRLRVRSYNQAAEIAVRLGGYLQLPVYSELLIRQKRTDAQKNLNRGQRLQNLNDAFLVNTQLLQYKCSVPGYNASPQQIQYVRSGQFSGENRILLVDDIFTTGATADSAAHALHGAGFMNIYLGVTAITG